MFWVKVELLQRILRAVMSRTQIRSWVEPIELGAKSGAERPVRLMPDQDFVKPPAWALMTHFSSKIVPFCTTLADIFTQPKPVEGAIHRINTLVFFPVWTWVMTLGQSDIVCEMWGLVDYKIKKSVWQSMACHQVF